MQRILSKNHYVEIVLDPSGLKFKASSGNTRTMCRICSKLTMKTLERRQLRRFGVFVASFEHISPIVLVFSSLALNR